MVKYPPASAGDAGDTGSIPGLGRSPTGYSLGGRKELDMTERLSMHAETQEWMRVNVDFLKT